MSETMKAISVRQPWAWLIVNGHKDIENRSLRTWKRERVLIHASARMTVDDYATAWAMADENGIALPAFDELERGGIVGQVEIDDCVDVDLSPWFFGPWGWVLKKAKPLPFVPWKGKQGWFEVPKSELRFDESRWRNGQTQAGKRGDNSCDTSEGHSDSELYPSRFESGTALIKSNPKSPGCRRCRGYGELRHAITMEFSHCPDCFGTGASGASNAGS
jgi:hypothetical protein